VGQALDLVLAARRDPGRAPWITVWSSFAGLEDWAYCRGEQLDLIRPGKPVENPSAEAFHERLRDACLNVHQSMSLPGALLRHLQRGTIPQATDGLT